jgi:hypothetical protein
MKTRKIALSALLFGTVVVWSTFAYQGNPGTTNPDCQDPARRESIQTMLTSKNYEGWKTLMAGKGVVSRINSQEKFELYVALRSAASVGDKATVEKLSAQLGLGQKKMDGTGLRNGGGKGMGQRHSQ